MSEKKSSLSFVIKGNGLKWKPDKTEDITYLDDPKKAKKQNLCIIGPLAVVGRVL